MLAMAQKPDLANVRVRRAGIIAPRSEHACLPRRRPQQNELAAGIHVL